MAKEKLFESYLTTASALVRQYDGYFPLNDFLKKYFSLHKKFGSRDRKHITELCYCNYRIGHALKNSPIHEKILAALFLCAKKGNELLAQLKPEWNEKAELPLKEKILLLNSPFNITDIFPFKDEISYGVDATAFAASHLVQPDLFLRIRPNKKKQVLKKLQENKIEFEECAEDCLRLSNTTKIENILEVNNQVVVQDYSSQRIKEFLEFIKSEARNPKFETRSSKSEIRSSKSEIRNAKSAIRVWDCCAASGGKSILAVDVLKSIDLTVSDVRPSITNNLKRRFEEAGIKSYHSFIVDLTNSKFQIQSSKFDLIVCDAPCTGSGTWSRTPEQLYFFKTEKINYYAELQKKIVSNTVPYLKKNGYILYITCSLFRKENEDIVGSMIKNFHLQLIKQKVFTGYHKKADTMFAALLKNVDKP